MVHTDNTPKQDRMEERRSKEKKAYQSPSLVEWGDIRDLTQGTDQGLEDVPEGGTNPAW